MNFYYIPACAKLFNNLHCKLSNYSIVNYFSFFLKKNWFLLAGFYRVFRKNLQLMVWINKNLFMFKVLLEKLTDAPCPALPKPEFIARQANRLRQPSAERANQT